jgi:FkbM family methyltransferase
VTDHDSSTCSTSPTRERRETRDDAPRASLADARPSGASLVARRLVPSSPRSRISRVVRRAGRVVVVGESSSSGRVTRAGKETPRDMARGDARDRRAPSTTSVRAKTVLGLAVAVVVTVVVAARSAAGHWRGAGASLGLGLRPLATSDAARCDDEYVDLSARVKRHSKSQDGEDRYLIDTYFRGLCGGTYLELGALDGVRFSNSHLFEFGFGWSGVLIEPNPKSFAALQTNRPKNRLHNVAVCDVSREVHFMRGDEGAVTGIFEFMSPSFRAEWHKKSMSSRLRDVSDKIRCEPLRRVLKTDYFKKKHIDFLSLDVEGAEYEVLKTIDFTAQQFGVIFYEADPHNVVKNEIVKSYLEVRGYRFQQHALRSNFHVNERFHDIYAHLAYARH